MCATYELLLGERAYVLYPYFPPGNLKSNENLYLQNNNSKFNETS